MKEGWVMIYASTELYKAKIVEGILKQNGIESHILEKGDSAIPSIGEVKLFAPEEKAEQALEVLQRENLIEEQE